MEPIVRIQRVSRKIRYLCFILLIVLPLLNGLFWGFYNYFPKELLQKMLPIVSHHDLSLLARGLGFLVSSLPTGILMAGLYFLICLFQLYEKSKIFTRDNVRYFRYLSYTLLFWVISRLVYIAGISVVLTFQNPPGQRMLVLQVGSLDFTGLFVGSVVWLISWVMEEGCRLEEEQAYTI